MKKITDYRHCCDDCLRYEECRMKDEELNKYLRVSDLIHGCDHFIDKNDKYWGQDMEHNAKSYTKRKRRKSWRYLVGYWSPFIIGVIVFLTIFILKTVIPEKEPMPTSKPFYSPMIIIPASSYQTPSELLEEIVVEAVEAAEPVPVPDSSWAEEADYMAKVIYSLAHDIYSQTEQACIAWLILNQVDAGFGNSIHEVCMQQDYFNYNENLPTVDDYNRDLVKLSLGVIERWLAEKRWGTSQSGRVLPEDYFYFERDEECGCNYFYNALENSLAWDYSLPSPYDS